jgi:hypothetical protein|tara:strand:+ start:3992 stop:4639 length:648 start_codon:yes stop_codon:yes gene_type:complete
MITKVINDKMSAPIDFLRGYKDRKIPLYQGKASQGEMPENLPKDIEKIKKIKKLAESVEPTLKAIRNTIAGIKVAKAIAGAAADAGKIGSALVPPVAAAGVLQDKIIEKVKEEISDASAALKNTDFLINQLKALAIETIIALLAIKLASLANGSGKGKDTGDDDLESTQQELDSLVALSEAEESNQNNDGNGGVTTITTTTTSTGTSTSTGGGGY